MAQIGPSAFYCSDERVVRLQLDGLAQSNTDAGKVYLSITTSGSTTTVDVYKTSYRQSATKVATGTATKSIVDTMSGTLTAANTSGMTGEFTLDFAAGPDATDTTTAEAIVAFTFDDDLNYFEKTIENLATSNAWEGAGGSGNRFILAHRLTTFELINKIRNAVDGVVSARSDNLMPDLLQIVDFERYKIAAICYALHIILSNAANGSSTDDVLFMKSQHYYERYVKEFAAVRVDVDRDADGDVDTITGGGGRVWK